MLDSSQLQNLISHSKREKVVIAVFCGRERQNWLNPELTLNLFKAGTDPRFEVFLHLLKDSRPWDKARNLAMAHARNCKMDWLVMVDNDQFVNFDLLDPIAHAPSSAWVITVPTGAILDAGTKMVASCAVVYVRRRAWEKLGQGPWFRWVPGSNETLDGPGEICEDEFFRKKCDEAGVNFLAYSEPAGHWRTYDVTSIAGGTR